MSNPSHQPEPHSPEQAAAERRAAMQWIGAVVAILGTSFTVAMVMLYVSANDPSFAVEPDFYDLALNWDDHAAQRQTNTELGWRVELTAQPGQDPGLRTINAVLTDSQDDPIEGATIHVVAFHNARAMDRFAFPMTTTGGGIFKAQQPLARAGLWEFRFTVATADSRYTDSMEFNLVELPGVGISR